VSALPQNFTSEPREKKPEGIIEGNLYVDRYMLRRHRQAPKCSYPAMVV